MKKSTDRVISMLLSLVVCIGMLTPSWPALRVNAASIKHPGAASTADTIYFGNYPQTQASAPNENLGSGYEYKLNTFGNANNSYSYKYEPISWRILENSSDGIFMISSKALDFRSYDNGTDKVIWANSEIRDWLNGTFYNKAFSQDEKYGVAESNLSNPEQIPECPDGVGTTDNVFMLSVDEAKTYFSNDNDRQTNNTEFAASNLNASKAGEAYADWFLRSQGNIDYNVGMVASVSENGDIKMMRTSKQQSIRPALRLDKSKIIMLSKAVNSKESLVNSTLSQQSAPSGDLKPTIVTSSLTLSAASNSAYLQDPAQPLNISYSGASTGAGRYISCVLEKNGEVKYYGKLKDISNSGDSSGDVTINFADIPQDNYKLKLFCEEIGADYQPDFASNPIIIDLALSPQSGAAPAIITVSLPGGVQGTPYSQTIISDGFPVPEFSVSGGDLPTGLTLASDGTISGTPSATGAYTFGVNASNMMGSDTKQYEIIISAAPVLIVPVITTTSLSNGVKDIAYTKTIIATGTPAPTFALTGNLPQGLILSTDGVISGIPSEDGVFDFDIHASNSAGTDTKSFSLTIEDNTVIPNVDKPMVTGYAPKPMNFNLNGVTNGYINISLGSSGNLAGYAELEVSDMDVVTLGDSTIDQDGTIAVAAGASVGSAIILVKFYDDLGQLMSGYNYSIAVSVSDSSNSDGDISNYDGGNNNDGGNSTEDNNGGDDSILEGRRAEDGGGGGGGGVTLNDPLVPLNTSSVSTYWYELSEINPLAAAARGNKVAYVQTNRASLAGIRMNALQSMSDLYYYHDTIKDKLLQVRVTIPNPSKANKDILLTGYVSGKDVEKTITLFGKWFTNRVEVIKLEQLVDFGQLVNITAKVNLSGMDTSKLLFYSYNPVTGVYRLIPNPNYRIDANGYLNLTTGLGGDIIVCEGTLVRK